MATLKELLEGDLNMGSSEKTASVSSKSVINDEIDKLALEMGIDFSKIAEEESKEEEEEKEEEKENGAEKKAAAESEEEEEKKEDKKEEVKKEASMSLDALFNQLYPEDATLDKTAAEMEKEAAEEAIGARAFEHFVARFDNRITKIASDLKSSSGTGKGIGEDASFPQELERDASPADQNAIGTGKKEGGEECMNKEERGAAASGHFEGDKLAAAMRKVMLKQAMKK